MSLKVNFTFKVKCQVSITRQNDAENQMGADLNTFYAYAISCSVWYVREGVLHLFGQASCVATKMKLQPNNGLNEF